MQSVMILRTFDYLALIKCTSFLRTASITFFAVGNQLLRLTTIKGQGEFLLFLLKRTIEKHTWFIWFSSSFNLFTFFAVMYHGNFVSLKVLKGALLCHCPNQPHLWKDWFYANNLYWWQSIFTASTVRCSTSRKHQPRGLIRFRETNRKSKKWFWTWVLWPI